jgi:hypothetical protein
LGPPNPQKRESQGTQRLGFNGREALSLNTGMGDGEYSVIAEIVDFGELQTKVEAIWG